MIKLTDKNQRYIITRLLNYTVKYLALVHIAETFQSKIVSEDIHPAEHYRHSNRRRNGLQHFAS